MSRVAPLAGPWSDEDAAGIARWGHPDRTYEPLLLVGCAYEWGGQAAFWGPIAGVSDDECDALVTGTDPGWGASERTLNGAVDEIERTGNLAEHTWNALGEYLDDEQRMELLIAVG